MPLVIKVGISRSHNLLIPPMKCITYYFIFVVVVVVHRKYLPEGLPGLWHAYPFLLRSPYRKHITILFAFILNPLESKLRG